MTSESGRDSSDGSQLLLSRRTLLIGAGGAVVLAACGQSSTTSAGPGSTQGAAAKLNLAPRFDVNEYATAGSEQRMVVSLVDSSGVTPTDAPPSIEVTITDKDGKAVGKPVTALAQSDGVPVPYYPVRFTFDAPGTYKMATAQGAAQAFKVAPAGSMPFVQPGAKLKGVNSPTVTNARGVDPICTRSKGICALHELDLVDAMAASKPTALLISTPKFCQIGVCGPVLELFLEQRAAFPDVQFIHAEVYKAPDTNPANPSAGGLAPVVEAFGLNFEPSLYFASADNTVVRRLDNVFDRAEIKAGLEKLA
jgi:hypothetical protein